MSALNIKFYVWSICVHIVPRLNFTHENNVTKQVIRV